MALYKDIMPYFDIYINMFMVEIKYIVVPLKDLDTPKFYNGQF